MNRFRPRLSASVLAVALLAGPLAVRAETTADVPASPPAPIVTDRPTDSASPQLVPRHAWQFELGYKFSRTDDESGRTDTQELPDLLLRYGISERVEARFVTTGWTFQDKATGSESGLNDVSLGAKFALAEERGSRPQMALLADVSLPSGDSEFTSDYVIPKILFLAANSLSDRVGLTYNLGPSLVTSKNNGETVTNWNLNYAVALSGAVSGPFSLFGEVYGGFDFGDGRPDRHTFQAGTTVQLSPRVQIDFRGGVGLVDNVPDWLAGAGLAFRLPR